MTAASDWDRVAAAMSAFLNLWISVLIPLSLLRILQNISKDHNRRTVAGWRLRCCNEVCFWRPQLSSSRAGLEQHAFMLAELVWYLPLPTSWNARTSVLRFATPNEARPRTNEHELTARKPAKVGLSGGTNSTVKQQLSRGSRWKDNVNEEQKCWGAEAVFFFFFVDLTSEHQKKHQNRPFYNGTLKGNLDFFNLNVFFFCGAVSDPNLGTQATHIDQIEVVQTRTKRKRKRRRKKKKKRRRHNEKNQKKENTPQRPSTSRVHAQSHTHKEDPDIAVVLKL